MRRVAIGGIYIVFSYLVRRQARERQRRQRRKVSWRHFPSRAVFCPASSGRHGSSRSHRCSTPSPWNRHTIAGVAHRGRRRPLPLSPLPPRRALPRHRRPRAGRRSPMRDVDAVISPGAGRRHCGCRRRRRHGRSPARLDTWPAGAATTTVASNVPPGSAALVNVSCPRCPQLHPRQYYLRRPSPSPCLRHRATWRHDRCYEALPLPGPSEPSHH